MSQEAAPLYLQEYPFGSSCLHHRKRQGTSDYFVPGPKPQGSYTLHVILGWCSLSVCKIPKVAMGSSTLKAPGVSRLEENIRDQSSKPLST